MKRTTWPNQGEPSNPVRIYRSIVGAFFVALIGLSESPLEAQSIVAADRPTLFEWTFGPWETEEVDRESLATDRPDFTEASSTVGLRTIQIEFGYTFTKDSAGGNRFRSHSWGEPLLRIGALADWFELRAAAFPTRLETTIQGAPNRVSGWEDLYLGCKIGLTPQKGWLPEMAVIPQMTVPSGGSAFTTGHTLAGVNWCYGWNVNEQWAIGASTQFNRAVDEGDILFTEWAQSVTLIRSWTEQLSSYTEWYGIFPDDAVAAPTQYYFNGGFALLFSPDVQWDIRAGLGLSEAADDFFFGTGLSLRFR